MAISHVDSNTGTETGATSVTVTKPTGTAADDLLVAFFSSNNQDCTPPAGWTELHDEVTEVFRTQVFYKIAGGSEAANYSFSIDASAPIVATISCFRGIDTSDPIDDSAIGSSLTHSEPYTTPSLTAASSGRLLYYRTSRIVSATVPTYTASGPTEISDVGIFSGGTVSYAQGIYFATSDYTGSSQSGLAITCAVAEAHNVVMTLGIKVASIPGTMDFTMPSIPAVDISANWSIPATLGAIMPIPSMSADGIATPPVGTLSAAVPITVTMAANVNPQGTMTVGVIPTMTVHGETRHFAENVITVTDEHRWFIILQDEIKIGNRKTARRELIIGATMPLPTVAFTGSASFSQVAVSATAYSPTVSVKALPDFAPVRARDSGNLNVTMPVPTVDISGATISGAMSVTLPSVPSVSISANADITISGPLAGDMPLPTVDITAKKVNIVYAVDIGNGSTTSFTVTHNLGSRDVLTCVYEAASPYEEVLPTSITHATTNTITVVFPSAPSTNQYRVVVVYG